MKLPGHGFTACLILLANIPAFGRLFSFKNRRFELKASCDDFAGGNIAQNSSSPSPRTTDKIACQFCFNGPHFLNQREVKLTESKHFHGRSNCLIRFANLPEGRLHFRPEKIMQIKR